MAGNDWVHAFLFPSDSLWSTSGRYAEPIGCSRLTTGCWRHCRAFGRARRPNRTRCRRPACGQACAVSPSRPLCLCREPAEATEDYQGQKVFKGGENASSCRDRPIRLRAKRIHNIDPLHPPARFIIDPIGRIPRRRAQIAGRCATAITDQDLHGRLSCCDRRHGNLEFVVRNTTSICDRRCGGC